MGKVCIMRIGDAEISVTWFRGSDSYLDVSDAMAVLDPDHSVIMACNYNGTMGNTEGTSAAMITMRCIAKQAIALGFLSDSTDTIALFPGPGTEENNEQGFVDAVSCGYPVLYDNCFGFGDIALVKDEWLTHTFDSNGRTAITAGPITRGIKELVTRRMVVDACRKFAGAVGGKQASFLHEGAAVQNCPVIVEIATLGHRRWNDGVPRWKTREFEITACDYAFLQRAVSAVLEDGCAKAACDVDALSDVWRNALESRHIFFSFDDKISQYKNMIMETARDLGIDYSVEAYYADVPIEDIIA